MANFILRRGFSPEVQRSRGSGEPSDYGEGVGIF